MPASDPKKKVCTWHCCLKPREEGKMYCDAHEKLVEIEKKELKEKKAYGGK
jgi:hypothetical protein